MYFRKKRNKKYNIRQMKNNLCAVYPAYWERAHVTKPVCECEYAYFYKVLGDTELPAFVIFSDEPINYMNGRVVGSICDEIVRDCQELKEFYFYEIFPFLSESDSGEWVFDRESGFVPSLLLRPFFDVVDASKNQLISAIQFSNTPDGEPAIICHKSQLRHLKEYLY